MDAEVAPPTRQKKGILWELWQTSYSLALNLSLPDQSDLVTLAGQLRREKELLVIWDMDHKESLELLDESSQRCKDIRSLLIRSLKRLLDGLLQGTTFVLTRCNTKDACSHIRQSLQW
jgi:hypothetical protein